MTKGAGDCALFAFWVGTPALALPLRASATISKGEAVALSASHAYSKGLLAQDWGKLQRPQSACAERLGWDHLSEQ